MPLQENLETSSAVYKGIALFTPAGDLVYCVDPSKQSRWHLHLCALLQELLGLPEPPHFLVPAYTATIDRWIDPYTGELKVSAEAFGPVIRHQALLNAVFGTGDLRWEMAYCSEECYSPLVLATYRSQFPQLWEEHELVMRFDQTRWHINSHIPGVPDMPKSPDHNSDADSASWREDAINQGYVLRLFVSGTSAATERTLERLHHLLEQTLTVPYTLKVIDVLKHPDQAEEDQVSATPTLLKVWPKPVRRIVGELDNVEDILRILSTLE
ncbi:circadian clock KaiB family protein [Ancylothrix sp. D3o]|uniref:circadian clock KaiB family protein n=1 Tax=Ancylothrix sp. D3o TaxID=2953691 RepID=UPI0021BB197E|nr:circadian clock KaiB family protein [Ancylothrix sp. D3o]